MKKILSIVAILFAATQIYAQSVPFVNISANPYSNSMGGTTLVLESNPFTVAENASAMTFSESKGSAGVSYNSWQPWMLKNNILGVSGYAKFGKFAVGISGKYNGYSAYDIVSDKGEVTGSFTPNEMSVEAAAGFRFAKNFSAGVNVRYISSKLSEESSGGAIAADVSATFMRKGLMVAVAATNLGTNMDYGNNPFKLPAMVKVGAGYSFGFADIHKLNVNVEGDYLLTKSGIMAGAGLEYSIKDMAKIRAGYHYGGEENIPSYASVGIGVKIIGITLDAAYLFGGGVNAVLNGSFGVALGYSF